MPGTANLPTIMTSVVMNIRVRLPIATFQISIIDSYVLSFFLANKLIYFYSSFLNLFYIPSTVTTPTFPPAPFPNCLMLHSILLSPFRWGKSSHGNK